MNMNETLTNIANRYSAFEFTDQVPDEETLAAITNAAITAPSARNLKPWQVILVTNRGLIDKLEAATVKAMGELPAYKKMSGVLKASKRKLLRNAPAMILLPIDKSNPYAKYDCGIVSQTICIAAQSLGVGSRIIAICDIAFDSDAGEKLKADFRFPKGYDFGLAVLLGYDAEAGGPQDPMPSKITRIK